MLLRKLTLAVTLALSANVVYANCGDITGKVSIVGNEFPAIHTVAKGAAECASDSVACLLYTSPSPRDGLLSRMPSSA